MSTKVPSQAKFYGLREGGVKILIVITSWLNGNELKIRGEKRSFITHHDAPLEEMFRNTNWDYSEVADAHERLLDKGILKETYVCRRKIDWAPTQLGRQAIRDVVTANEKISPVWTWATDRTGPLYGDPNEGVVHRKGVLIAGRMLPRIPWAYDIDNGPYGFEYYPTDHVGESCHDFHLATKPGM